jgi:hypothetical protein
MFILVILPFQPTLDLALGVQREGSGEPLGAVQIIFGFGPEIWVPADYQSGGPLNSSEIFQDETLASIGLPRHLQLVLGIRTGRR